jgi:hypothetical protein
MKKKVPLMLVDDDYRDDGDDDDGRGSRKMKTMKERMIQRESFFSLSATCYSGCTEEAFEGETLLVLVLVLLVLVVLLLVTKQR